MTFTITRFRLAIFVLVVALISPATVLATHVFDDVPDNAFYTDAVTWANDNGITSGYGDGRFGPDDGVTRAQNVTFAKRYHDNLAPAAAQAVDKTPIDNGNGLERTHSLQVDAPADGYLLVTATTVMGEDDTATGTGNQFVEGWIELDGVQPSTLDKRIETIEFGGVVQDYDITFVVTHLVPVTKGDHTITSHVTGPGGLFPIFVYQREIQALFVAGDVSDAFAAG